MDTILIGFVFYLILVILFGYYAARQTKNLKDFALGGHRLGPVIIAFSERASAESAWLIIGLPGAALMAGVFELWTVLGCIIGIIFSWYMIAKPLRQATEKYNVITLPELFSKKFNDQQGLIRLLSSLIIIFFFTFYVAAQFSAAGKVLNVTFGISQNEGMLLGAMIIIFYTLLGGFFAVAWTDLIQGIIMFGTLIILPIVGFIELKGINEYSGPFFDMTKIYDGKVGMGAFIAAIGGLSWGLGYMGQPHLVTRYMAIDNSENIYIARRIALVWAIPAFIGSMIMGIVGIHLINFELLPSLTDPEQLMPLMAKLLLPTWLAGILVSGAIAAMMSTADSQLLVSSTVITEDIFKRYINSKNLLLVGRLVTILIGVIAFIMAWKSKTLVYEMVSYAWSGLGSSFGPALLLALWWKRTSKIGILLGMIFGTFFTIFDITDGIVTTRLTSYVIAFISIIIGSLFIPDNRYT